MSMTGYAKKNKMPESTLRGILKKKGLLLTEAEWNLERIYEKADM